MFFPVQVQPEVGESAAGYPYPYIQGGQPQMSYVQGLVKKVNEDKREIKIQGFKKWIPFHRIIVFTFGGIELLNEDYDDAKRWEEDRKIVESLKKKGH
jgi:NADH dehydrogenase FAD-containing subunit